MDASLSKNGWSVLSRLKRVADPNYIESCRIPAFTGESRT